MKEVNESSEVSVVEENISELVNNDSCINRSMLISEEHVAEALEQAGRINRIKIAAIKCTTAEDWVSQNGKPYMEISGTDKVSMFFGIQMDKPDIEKESETDELGRQIIYISGSMFYWGSRNRRYEEGTCSTRDQFFGTKHICDVCSSEKIDLKGKKCFKEKCNGKPHKVFKKICEIDLTNIRKKSKTNCYQRGVKGILGLKSFTWSDLEEAGIRVDAIKGFKYGGKSGGKKKTFEMTEARKELQSTVLELCGGNEDDAKKYLVDLTKFNGTDGKPVPGEEYVINLSDNRVKFSLPKAEKALDAHKKKNGMASPESKPAATGTQKSSNDDSAPF